MTVKIIVFKQKPSMGYLSNDPNKTVKGSLSHKVEKIKH